MVENSRRNLVALEKNTILGLKSLFFETACFFVFFHTLIVLRYCFPRFFFFFFFFFFLTLKVPITTAVDDIHRYCIVLRESKT